MFNRRALAITVILLGIFLFCTFTVLTALASYYAVPSDALLHPYPIDMPPFPADPHVQPEDTTNATWSNFDGFAYHVEPRSDKNETIPRILHWTWKDELLPERWRVVRKACMDMHSDYQHILWTDAMSLDFLKRYYPWFVSTFESYPYNIQRADSIRYFILYHYGGTYIDLDIGCRRRVDPLLQYPVVLAKTIPVGVSNDLMFSERKSSFMESVIHNLQTFNHKYFSHYPTVMFSTGPMFISTIYGFWMGNHPDVHKDRDAVRVIPKSLYGKNAKVGTVPDSFFDHYYGSSWHADDAGFITFLGRWGRGLLLIGGFVLFIGVVRLVFYRRRRTSGMRCNSRQMPPPAYLFPDSHFFDWRGQQIPLLPFTNQTSSRPASPSRSSSMAGNLANSIPAILYYPFNPSTWASPTLPQTPLSQSTPGVQSGILTHLLSYVLPKSWMGSDDYDEVEQDESEEEEQDLDAPPTPFSHHRSTTWARMEFQRAREMELQRIKEGHGSIGGGNGSGSANAHVQQHGSSPRQCQSQKHCHPHPHPIDKNSSSSDTHINSLAQNLRSGQLARNATPPAQASHAHHSHDSHQEEIEALLASLEPQLSQHTHQTQQND
ncbi:hypothetical protein E3P81_01283 [Wallemia ichthyophaga]|nr:hypothetical protein E3P97_01284 [Wallemia ichthyophaga]TIB34195.1 hypothetical protein E3P85_01033 [Wallemia ichthyophaga]TIB48488.1 hypothetical protein E3P82_01282 [Wallemia ichthyophaga]TIB52611.1 hypothetical protein E3P81_01283 [Wallemia ichthyophaga]TIB55274.1 hypothetical protein E3P80_01283 [Wallemia ichthyophaga]